MGRTIQLTCPSCLEEWEFQIGHGIIHATLENVLSAFSQEVQARILSDTAAEKFPRFTFRYRLAICPACHKIAAVAELKLHTAGTTFTAPCPDCGGAVLFPGENSDILCPNCGKEPLNSRAVGFWD